MRMIELAVKDAIEFAAATDEDLWDCITSAVNYLKENAYEDLDGNIRCKNCSRLVKNCICYRKK